MFAEFGPAPLCLELDFDSFDGPPHWVARLRQKSGWLMVAEATIQSEHDILSDKLVVACDEEEAPIPSFKARNLIHCSWINPTYCDELPPDILEDLICEQEGALIARWHREKNTALANAFDEQEARIAEIEGRAQFLIKRNEGQIGQLRQRRRHPDATPEMRRAMAEIIRELDQENDELLDEMAEARAAIRERAAEFEETLWDREDLLIEVTPLHLIRWTARSHSYADVPTRRKPYSTLWIPACGRTGGSTPKFDNMEGQLSAELAKSAAQNKAKGAIKDVVAVRPKAETLKHSPAVRKLLEKARKSGGMASPPSSQPMPETSQSTWSSDKIDLLRQLWLAGIDEWKIGSILRGVKTSEVIEEARKLGLPPRENCSILPETSTTVNEAPRAAEVCAAPTGWTDDRVARLTAMWRAGKSAREIANALGNTSRNAVIGKAGRLGLPRREAMIAKEDSISVQQAHNKPGATAESEPDSASHWTPERVELLEALWLDGSPAEEIARVLGLRRSQVIGKAHRLELSTEARPKVFDEVPSPRVSPAPVQNALTALSAARKRYYGQD